MRFLVAITALACCIGCSNFHAQSATQSEAVSFFSALSAAAPDSAKSMISHKLGLLRSSKDIIKLTDAAEETIGSTASDLHNEVIYNIFLQAIVGSGKLSTDDKLRPALLLENSQKNQVGGKAADIAYELPDGSRHSILAIATPLTLIYFNDPDCNACHKVKENLAHSTMVKRLCDEKKLTVIGIYPFANKEAWQSQHFPDFVSNGWDYAHDIDDNATYDLPTMPLFYLLGADKTVLLKNEPSLKAVERFLDDLASEPHIQ